MTPDLQQNESSQGLMPLINGIVEDAQTLVRQELSLFQSDLKEELGRTKTAAVPLVSGLAVSLLAGFFLFTAVARWLMFEWPQLSDFAAYGLVGAVLAVVGTILVVVGMTLVNAIGASAKNTVKPLQEKVQWKTRT